MLLSVDLVKVEGNYFVFAFGAKIKKNNKKEYKEDLWGMIFKKNTL